MPVAITTVPSKTPVPFAKTKEYQDLQAAINNAKQSLDDVSKAVVAIEAKLNPPSADNVQAPGEAGRGTTPLNTDELQGLAEMLKIAGLRN